MEKKLLYSAIILASFAAIMACTKEVDIQEETDKNANVETISLTINAVTPETKTVFGDLDAGAYPITWSATGEAIELVEIIDPTAGDDSYSDYTSTGYSLSDANATAVFTVNLAASATEGTYDYRALYPASAYTETSLGYSDIALVIPSTQTPAANSPDPAATILVAASTGHASQATSSLNLSFSHVTAYGKMTIKNANDVIGGGETIESVSISVPAGGVYYYWASGNTNSINATKTDSVTINTDNIDTSDDFVVWFTCKPYSLESGDQLTVTVKTDVASYVRHIALTKSLAFVSGQVSKFGVDMSTANPVIYSTAFNYSIVGSSYTGSDPIEGADAAGTKWYITYGNWNSSNCAQLRVYNTGNFGVIYNDFDCSGVTKVYYDAKVSNTALKLNTYYSTDSGSSWTKVDDAKSLTTDFVRYSFDVSTTGAYPKVRIKFEVTGTKPSSSNYQLTIDNVDINGKGSIILDPSITAANITGIPAIGVTDEDATYTIHNFSGADDIVASCDGTVVTDADVDNNGNITYSVAPNYGTASRSTGTITLTSSREGVDKVISVTQLGETFSASVEAVTILKDATTGSFTITSPTFGWNVQVNQGDGKNLVLTSSSSGSGDADPQTITFSSSTEATSSEQTLGTIVVYRNGNTGDTQKKTITIKKASNAVASTYTKVTSLTAGADYLLVHVAGSKAANGTISSNTLQSSSVTISGTTITGSDTIDGYAMTITALTGDDAGYYSLLIDSNYIGCKSSGTDIQLNASLASDYFKWSISIDNETGLATITNKSRTDRFIGWNNSSGWKAYSTSNYATYPRPYLFKKD